jgi:GTPase SAR1 family protein
MRNADGVILVYDINSPSSFEKVNVWLNAVRQVTKENTTIFLLGNKVDLVSENKAFRRVLHEKVSSYVSDNAIDYWTECSAKTGENLKDTFVRFYTG